MIRTIVGAVAVAISSTQISAETYRSAEYGYLLQTSEESVQLWDESASFCVLNMELPRAPDQMFEVMGLRFAEEGDEAKLWIDGMLRPIRGTRIETLPSTCLDKDYSPSEIVALVGETFAERYPFFHLYDVDWSARVANVQSALPDGASEEDLRKALIALVSGLDDGHIEVSFGEDSFSPEVLPVWAEAAQNIGLITHSYEQIAAIAAKASKEVTYHLERSADTVVGLGDGTEESHARMQAALDYLWPYVGEMFVSDDVDAAMVAEGVAPDPKALREEYDTLIGRVLADATLTIPDSKFGHTGGRDGRMHTEHLGHLLTQMQWLQRAYPGATW